MHSKATYEVLNSRISEELGTPNLSLLLHRPSVLLSRVAPGLSRYPHQHFNNNRLRTPKARIIEVQVVLIVPRARSTELPVVLVMYL